MKKQELLETGLILVSFYFAVESIESARELFRCSTGLSFDHILNDPFYKWFLASLLLELLKDSLLFLALGFFPDKILSFFKISYPQSEEISIGLSKTDLVQIGIIVSGLYFITFAVPDFLNIVCSKFIFRESGKIILTVEPREDILYTVFKIKAGIAAILLSRSLSERMLKPKQPKFETRPLQKVNAAK